jgi:hypothetical protein
MPPDYVPPPRALTPDLETRLLELLGAEDAEDPANDQQFIDQLGTKHSAVQSEDYNAPAPTAYQNHGFQLPAIPADYGMGRPLDFPQSGGYGNVSTQPVDRGLLLGGYTPQEITYRQALLAASVPYREVFQDQHPLQWALLAHALDRAAPPREAFAYFSTMWCAFWLPCQADFNKWDGEDSDILQAACMDCNIWLDWDLLDQFGVQAQLVPGHHSFPPIHNPPQSEKEASQLSPAAVAHFSGAPASVAAPPAQSQQSLPVPTSSTSQIATSSRKGNIKRFVFSAEQILQPSKNVNTTIELSTAAERAACTPDTSWYKPENPEEVRKVPQSDEELLPSVLALKRSMMDTSQAKDKKDDRSSYAKRWSSKALNKKWPVPPKEMEAICWIIAKMVRRYHLEGPAFLNLFDELHQEKANRNQDLTFKQRIQAICTVLLSSKARVDKCLKHESLGSLVAFPLSVLGISLQNREFNDKRKDLIKAGNKFKEAEANAAASATAVGQVAPADEEEENEDEEGEDSDRDAEGDKDDGNDEKEKDNGNDGDDAGAGFSQPDASHDRKSDRDNGDQSRPQNGSKFGTKSSKSPPASGYGKQTRTGLPAAPGASTKSSTQVLSTPPIRGDTADRLSQIRAIAATADAPLHDPATPVERSRKRPATEHLGLGLPSAPKRSRNDSYTYSSDGTLYGGPGTSIEPALVSSTKRRATEAGMEDTNTREKRPRSLDRKIIAPKRRPDPS